MFNAKTNTVLDDLLDFIRIKPYSLQKRVEAGTPPGTLAVHEDAHETQIEVIAYSNDEILVIENVDVDTLKELTETWAMTWINITGLDNIDVIQKLGKYFSLHPLALEDVLNTHQRPKTEDYDNHAYTVLRMSTLLEQQLDLEQVSLFICKNCVITIQERPGDCFAPLRARIHKSSGSRKRLLRPDYLAYCIIDRVIDSNFPILELYDDLLNQLEDQILSTSDKSVIENVHRLKHDFYILRRTIWPHREAISRLEEDTDLISEDTHFFLRDCEDHVIQLLDIVETFSERASSLNDLYLSSVSQRTNEIMKTLTIIATITMPMAVVAGIYGMNFNPEASPLNMPELNWAYGYFFALALMGGVVVGMLGFFWRKGWIGK